MCNILFRSIIHICNHILNCCILFRDCPSIKREMLREMKHETKQLAVPHRTSVNNAKAERRPRRPPHWFSHLFLTDACVCIRTYAGHTRGIYYNYNPHGYTYTVLRFSRDSVGRVVFNICPRARGTIPHPRRRYIRPCIATPSSKYLQNPGICRRIMLLKGGYCAATGGGGPRGDLLKVRKVGGERCGECTSARTRVDLFLETASRLFPSSLRNQAVHHVSPFFLSLSLSWQSRFTHRLRIQDDPKAKRY